MTQEDKELLMKDLSARLSYGVRYKHFTWDDEHGETCIAAQIYSINTDGYVKNSYDDETEYIDNVRPYLFPLSSLTEEQKEEYVALQQRVIYNGRGLVNLDVMKYVNWCYKHHIDINGLIEKGFAIDATVSGIY